MPTQTRGMLHFENGYFKGILYSQNILWNAEAISFQSSAKWYIWHFKNANFKRILYIQNNA